MVYGFEFVLTWISCTLKKLQAAKSWLWPRQPSTKFREKCFFSTAYQSIKLQRVIKICACHFGCSMYACMPQATLEKLNHLLLETGQRLFRPIQHKSWWLKRGVMVTILMTRADLCTFKPRLPATLPTPILWTWPQHITPINSSRAYVYATSAWLQSWHLSAWLWTYLWHITCTTTWDPPSIKSAGSQGHSRDAVTRVCSAAEQRHAWEQEGRGHCWGHEGCSVPCNAGVHLHGRSTWGTGGAWRHGCEFVSKAWHS